MPGMLRSAPRGEGDAQKRGVRRARTREAARCSPRGARPSWPGLPRLGEILKAGPKLLFERSVAVTLAGPDLKKHACPKEETWTRKSRAGFGVRGRKPRPAPPAELLGPSADSVPGEPGRLEPPRTRLPGLLLLKGGDKVYVSDAHRN